MPNTRKPYPPEFREQMVALVWAGPGVLPKISLTSLNRPPSRSATGWLKPIAIPVGGPTASRRPSVPS